MIKNNEIEVPLEGHVIKKEEITAYFDALAPVWDEGLVCCGEKIRCILDHAGVKAGKRVLDVACGTGVMIPYYLERQVSSVTAVDISPEMIRIARSKFPQKEVRFLCGDIEEVDAGENYDAVIVYNAFPHFQDPARLLAALGSLLKIGGTLTVAHGMSREKINAHHAGSARNVSNGLMEADSLTALFPETVRPTFVLSTEAMYQVTGVRV